MLIVDSRLLSPAVDHLMIAAVSMTDGNGLKVSVGMNIKPEAAFTAMKELIGKLAGCETPVCNTQEYVASPMTADLTDFFKRATK